MLLRAYQVESNSGMARAEATLKKQKDLAKQVEILERNYRKYGLSWRSGEDLSKRREKLDALMTKFRANR